MSNKDSIRKKDERKGMGIDLPLIVLFLFTSAILMLGILWILGSTKTIMVTYEGKQDYIKPITFIFLYDRSCDAFFSPSSTPQPNIHYLYNYLDKPSSKNKEALINCIIYFLEKRINSDVIIKKSDKRGNVYIQRALFEVKEGNGKGGKEVMEVQYTHNIYKITQRGVEIDKKKFAKTTAKKVIEEIKRKVEEEAEEVVNGGIDIKNSLVKKMGEFSFGISNLLHIPYTEHVKWSKEKVTYTSYMPLKYKGKVYAIYLIVYHESLNVKKKS